MSYSLTRMIIVPRKSASRHDRLVQMSNKLFNLLQLEENQEFAIRIGRTDIKVKLQTIDASANQLILPEHILTEFSLPIQDYYFQAIYRPENRELQLGPVIGLLTDFPAPNQDEPHFRSVHLFCEELHRGISETGGFFYVFSYDHFSNQGFYFDNGKWVPSRLPIADVIYNRIHSRRLEQQESYKKFRKRLEELMIPLFNDRFLSKWEVHEQVSNETRLLSYIPETRIFSKEHLIDLINKYETVFLKPIHGSQGRNIIKVIKETENHYTIQTSQKVLSNHFNRTYSLDEIYQQIKPFLQNRIYIVQEGITLITNESKAMDFRVLCHKNLNSEWEVTSVVARIAAEQEFVSNLARGGTITRPMHALRSCMNRKKALETLALMKELALETASAVSRHTIGITGELGIDIGVDLDGKLWLIEVNSKPSKNFEDGLGKIRPSAKAIIQFCTKLGFDLP